MRCSSRRIHHHPSQRSEVKRRDTETSGRAKDTVRPSFAYIKHQRCPHNGTCRENLNVDSLIFFYNFSIQRCGGKTRCKKSLKLKLTVPFLPSNKCWPKNCQNLAFLACNHSQCIHIVINRWHIRWDTNAYNDRLLVFVDDYHRIFVDD